MLSNKIIEHLKQQGIYSEKEDEKYKAALINLGVDLNSDFAFFNLHVTYLQLIIPQYFISNKSGIWSLSLIVHSKG